MKPITSILIAGLLFIALQMSGQALVTSFSPATITSAVGSTVTLQFKVTNFTNINSVQFPIKYDQTKLQFVSVNGFALPDLSSGNFNSLPSQGVVRFTWFPDPALNPNGVTVADGTTVFTISFSVLATGPSTLNISGSVPPSIEVIRNGAPITVSYQTGGTTITGGPGNPPPSTFQVQANTIFIPKDSTRCMPVTVSNMTNVISMQYAMHWNTSVLQYQSTKAYDLPYLTGSDFNVPATPPGTLLLGWDDESLQGVTRANGYKIYEVCFKGVGAVGTNSLVTFDGTGIPAGSGGAEAFNTTNVNLWGASSGVTDTMFITAPPLPNTSLTFIVEKDSVPTGTQTCVDVKVQNFLDVVAMQFGLTYDPTKLQFQNISLGANPLSLQATVSGPNFVATPTIAAGTIRFIWDDSTAPFGVTVPDNTTIFSACFTAVAPTGTTSPVTIGNVTGLPAAFAREGVGEVSAVMTSGHVYTTNIPPCNVNGSVTNINCNGASTGAIALTVSAACPNRTFQWAGPNSYSSTAEDITGLAAGAYTVTVSFTGGTTQTATFTVTQPTAISATSTTTAVNCFGGTDGSITLTPAGGTAPYTFAWAGPTGYTSTAQSPTGLKAGNYTVVITDANSCSFTAPVIAITQPNAIAIPSNQLMIANTCFGQTNGFVHIGVTGGTAPYTFAWAGPNSFTATTEDINNLAAGAYTVTVTDSKSCTFVSSPAYTVQAPSAALTVTVASSQNVNCFGASTGSITINVSGGTPPYSYTWRDQSNDLVSNSKNPTFLGAGTYNVTVTDQAGCTTSLAAPVTITEPAAGLSITHTQTNVTCPGGNNGSINLNISGGGGSNTVTWSPAIPGGANPTGLAANTYIPTVTDQGGCSITYQAITITSPAAFSIGTPAVTNVTCAGSGNGGIVIQVTGGNGGPYDVIWNGSPLSGSAISALAGGSYTPVVTETATGCSASFSAIIVTEPTPITLDTNVTAQNGVNLGAIDLIVAGGTPNYGYAWAPGGANTQDLSNLTAGTYSVTVTDANACSIIGVYTVPQTNVVAGSVVTSVSNSCNNDGCINISVPAGASGPFQVNWTGGGSQTSPNNTISICNLASGPYSVTVTAPNGNSAVLTATVNQLPAAIVNSNFQQPFDNFANGSITLTPTFVGATYQWSYQNLTSSSISSLDSGLYVVTVTNPNSGCTAVYSFHLERQYLPYQASTTQVNPSCLSNNNGSIDLTVSGGNGPTYTYKWSGPNGFTAMTQDISNLAGGTYTVTVTDESGVPRTTTVTLVVQSLLAITNVNETSIYPGGFQVSAFNACDGAANVSFTGAVGNTSILWSNSATNASTNTLCGGAYSVTVTDGLGCSSVWSDALTVPEGVSGLSETSSPITCNGACNGAARVSVSGGVAPYMVKWSTGQNEPVAGGNDYSEAVNLCGGAYTVTITDNNGATTIVEVEVEQPALITVQFSDPIVPNTFNSCDGQLFANVAGAVEPLNIIWAGSLGHSGTGPRSEGLCANEVVQYVITDANNCAAIATDTVPYPVDGCLRVRPVLTPVDQDGNNDYVHITCIETVKHRVEIYNRWGQIVFETEDYQNNDDVNPGSTTTWYGLNKSGQPFAEGVYYYILTYEDVDGNEKQEKGHINLLK
ncbi:MAG: gliding motility-associated C-terminal domain-containing protein [Saprospiraceae bacterium]|nr:gliding motility-associated C-terminal domain-containing protein [Saprospiraceae bacterium]